MASGSGRTGSGSIGFDFGSDDVLCSYDEFGNQEASNGRRTDPATGSNPGKDFRESRMGRSSLSPVYNQPEESLYQDVIFTVEKTMKKYADNLLRFLEGISARLSQLELYCYDLEKSIGEMRSEITRENNEADSKLRSLEKHLQEVHRSVQILRDKQELADTQKELARLQLAQRESSTGSQSQQKPEEVAPSTSDPKKHDNAPEVQNQQLALALPHQINPTPLEQRQPAVLSSQTPPQNIHFQTQPNMYYPQQNQLPNPPSQAQPRPQDQYLQADSPYQRPQQGPQPPVSNVSQPQQVNPFPPYQQQWPQQFTQQVQQQSSLQAQIGAQTPPVYPSYPPTQPANSSPGTFPVSMPVPVSFPGIPQSGVIRPETGGYGYGGTARATVQQQPPQPNIQRQPQSQTQENAYGAPINDGAYPVSGSQPAQVPRQAYIMYDGEGGRVPPSLPPHMAQGGYPSTRISSLQNLQPIRQPSPSQMMRGHPYSELIEKAVSMGYARDYVVSVIQRIEESGQPVDVNTVLDRLNMHSSGGSQRAWSG